MITKTITTLTLCFYYCYFLAALESMVWLEQSSIIILTFTGVHVIIKLRQFADHFATRDGSLWPYRNFSRGLRTLLVVSDSLLTLLVLFGFIWVEVSDTFVSEMMKYVLCFLCTLVSGTNIIKHHKRQVEASISTAFSKSFP